MLKQYMSPTGPNKFQRGITPKGYKSQTRSVLCEYKLIPAIDVNILKDDSEKSGKLNCNRRK